MQVGAYSRTWRAGRDPECAENALSARKAAAQVRTQLGPSEGGGQVEALAAHGGLLCHSWLSTVSLFGML